MGEEFHCSADFIVIIEQGFDVASNQLGFVVSFINTG